MEERNRSIVTSEEEEEEQNYPMTDGFQRTVVEYTRKPWRIDVVSD